MHDARCMIYELWISSHNFCKIDHLITASALMNPMPAVKTTPKVKIQKTLLAEQVYDELKRQILDQRLAPGQRLNIDALTRECGISTSPLREALVRLVAEGLVTLTANAGFSVTAVPDEEHMGHLLEYRLMIESYCARLGALRRNASSLQDMRTATDGMAKMRKKGVGYRQFRAYLALEQSFHQALVDSACNPVISSHYQELHVLLSVARLSVIPDSGNFGSDEAVQEHRAVIAELEAGNASAAESAVQKHIEKAKGRMASSKR